MSDPIALLRALLAANWQRLIGPASDPDERDEDAVAHLDAARWLDAAEAGDPPPPVPSRAELAARLAECERQLTDVTRDLTTAVEERDLHRAQVLSMLAALRSIAASGSFDSDTTRREAGGIVTNALLDVCARLARIDREPPQRAAGVVAGAADRARNAGGGA